MFSDPFFSHFRRNVYFTLVIGLVVPGSSDGCPRSGIRLVAMVVRYACSSASVWEGWIVFIGL
jgi:hypothetical protein